MKHRLPVLALVPVLAALVGLAGITAPAQDQSSGYTILSPLALRWRHAALPLPEAARLSPAD